MATIRLATAAAVRSFQILSQILSATHSSGTSSYELARLIDISALEDEIGRFRVWSGNLGALQKGHSSADYRLRDSPLLASNALKLLEELDDNLTESIAVISGQRLPYEQQVDSLNQEEDEDDGFFSEDEDDSSEPGAPKTELEQRYREIVDIIDNLYKLSVRIRQPTLRTRSLKAASYRPKDPETGVDILEQYATFDLQHTKELVKQLRVPHTKDAIVDDDVVVERLGRAITLRRRQFKYWRRHRDKLGNSSLLDDIEARKQPPDAVRPSVELQRNDTLEVNVPTTNGPLLHDAVSEKTGKTLLSGTEATHHHQSLDDIVDSKSVTSYATTVRDLSGKGIELPPPPRAAMSERDFECPYCFIICPSRYGKGRPWKTHLLQDLQPYICTYSECENADQLFRSRREWSDHEASHRKAWRCPEHPNAVYKSRPGLENHLRKEHSDNVPQSQLESIVNVGETSTVDIREKCPICFAVADMEGLGGLQNHIAHHLERIASFSLPTLAEDDDSDGGSGVASRGGSETTDSTEGNTRNSSQFSFKTHSTQAEERAILDDTRSEDVATPTEDLLNAESLSNLPDASQQKLEGFLLPETTESDDSDSPIGDENTLDLELHMAEVDAFKAYLLSLPGAQSVRFYRRFGLWRGRVNFDTEASAIQALELKNSDQRFPEVKMKRRIANNRTSLRFDLPKSATEKMPSPERGGTEDEASVSSMSLDYGEEPHPEGHSPLLTVHEIPTLRSLYRSGKLVRKDQSQAPNDSYNQIISLCLSDITRLKVDCIVNSANRAMKITRTNDSLNRFMHLTAGPELNEECRRLGRVKVGEVRLTSGYALPCAHVIHAARPQYSMAITGMRRFNLLGACYRNALRTAMTHGIKTIAFPCLAAGGCGFPSRVASRIALQEVREFLDNHRDHPFERIIFCVFNRTDEKSYEHFLPVYFPPTHGDLENTVVEKQFNDYAAQIQQLITTSVQVNYITTRLLGFNDHVRDFPQAILNELTGIFNTLRFLEQVFENANEPIPTLTKRLIADVDLICSILQILSGSVNEMILQVDSNDPSSANESQKYTTIWDEYNFLLHSSHGMDLLSLLSLCQNFVQCLEDIIVRRSDEPDDMNTMRRRLASYHQEQRGEGDQGLRVHFDTVLYTREFQKEAPEQDRAGIVKAHSIPSLMRLYQLGELEQKPTLAIPDSRQLSTVCLIRHDITRLEVDAIVNTTSPDFGGVGMLDRTIFRKGGSGMADEISKFGDCQEGDVKVTQGYSLPCKNVIHAIPPAVYMSWEFKGGMRQLYADILFAASSLRAKTVAFPVIGSGALGQPPKDCAAVAMEAVKRFLETTDATNSITKIVFCVFGAHDEENYQSLLPVYFPPLDMNVNKALPETPDQPASTSERKSPSLSGSTESLAPRRTLFGSIGDAFRSVRFGKQPETEASRPLQLEEAAALSNFEDHASSCSICNDVSGLYHDGKNLCPDGYAAAQSVLKHLYMDPSHQVYSHNPDGTRVRVDIPSHFVHAWYLLVTVEKSYRDENRSRPFVSPNQPYNVIEQDAEEAPPPGVTIHTAEVTVPFKRGPEEAIATIHTWSYGKKELEPVSPNECSVHIHPGKVEIYDMDHLGTRKMTQLLSLELTHTAALVKSGSLDVALRAPISPDSKVQTDGDIVLRSRTPAECEMLFQRLKHARWVTLPNPLPSVEEVSGQESGTQTDDVLPGSNSQDSFFEVLVHVLKDSTWQQLHPNECRAYIMWERFLNLYPRYYHDVNKPLVSVALSALTSVHRDGEDVILRAHGSGAASHRDIILRSRNATASLTLLATISAAYTRAQNRPIPAPTADAVDLGELHRPSEKSTETEKLQSESESARLELPQVPTHPPRRKSSGFFSLFSQQSKEIPSTSQSTVEQAERPPSSLSTGETSSELPQRSVSRVFLDLADQMLDILRTTKPAEARVPFDVLAGSLKVPGSTVSELARYLTDLGLVYVVSEDLVWAPAQKPVTDVGSEKKDVPPVEPSSQPQSIPTEEALQASSSSTDNPSSDNPNLPSLDIDKFFTYLEGALNTESEDLAPQTSAEISEEPNSRSSAYRPPTPPAYPRPWTPRTVAAFEEHVRYLRPTSPDPDQPVPVPPGPARWTKIDRQIVSARALEEANERFEQRGDYVVVLRVLSREEIRRLAERTLEIRKGWAVLK